ncbi:MAG: 50S ribosomal protein L15 [Planctomycetota bacterium]
MNLNELLSKVEKHKRRKRVGRGRGSGHGKTCGRGSNGFKSRSGSGSRVPDEGGQTPLFRRIPKRGFNNKWRKNISIVNVDDLNRFHDGEEITPQRLLDEGLINTIGDGVKILGDGKLQRKLTIFAHKFSKTALEKIASAGGTGKEIKE